MVDTLLRARVPRWKSLNRAIDERDDMLDFAMQLFHHDRDAALASYFQNALEQFALVRHVARWRGKPRRMLDFASGYGRLTRLLVHEHLADEITVSDILEGGMAFQAEQFGVRTILSSAQPEQFAAPEKYDLIFVASLFTHLPPATFTPWLRRLTELLEPKGLLIFSVHDEAIAPETFEGGIAFESRSESRVLDVDDYGSTWVTEEYVREQVRAIGSEWACVRLPRALSDWQDVYVISPSPVANATPRRVPKGFLEEPQLLDEGIRIWGWATTIDAPPERVEIRIDDAVVASTRTFTHRGDVGKHFGVESATESGWECIVPHTSIRSFRYQVATISAFSAEGEERILFLGTIDSLLGTVARERAQALGRQLAERKYEIAELQERLAVSEHQKREREQQIAAMKASRFWKAREKWFRVKRAAGLTTEE
jgi:SAM-dependent methyltransferase